MTDGGTQANRRDWTGRVLEGRYRVERVLGTGGMGTVYLAHDERMDREVVVKVPHVRFLDDEGFRARFEKEIRSLTRLPHPHIVQAFDSGTAPPLVPGGDPVPYAVLAYLPGGSLKDRIVAGGGRQAPAEVLGWLPDVAGALDFIHDEGVVHRDVKPGNVLFDKKGNVFLADFGIAKALGGLDTGLTQTGATPGSPDYMAPEAVNGRLAPAYDQYALAVMVYEALAGQLPHRGETPIQVILAKQTQPPHPLSEVAPNVPPAAAAAVMQALAKDPERRFASCRQFASAFREGVERPVVAAAALPPPPAIPPRHRPATAAQRPPPSRRSVPAKDDVLAAPATRSRTGRRVALVVALLVVLAGGASLLFWKSGVLGAAEPALHEAAAVGGAAAAVVEVPEVRWDEPQDGATVAEATVHAKGALSKGRAADVVSVNGVEARRGPGAFDASVPLAAEGAQTLTLAVSDAGEARLSPLRRTVIYVAGWHTPVDGAKDAALAGNWEEVRRLLAAARAAGAKDADVPKSLRDGLAIYDAPPDVDITEPVDGARVSESPLRVRGALRSGRATDDVVLNGTVVRTGPGTFEATIPLTQPGANRVTVFARDGGVARGSPVERRVTYEASPWSTAVTSFLSAWAEPVGTSRDSATGYPKRVKRAKDGMEMVLIPAGTFQMGAVPGDSSAASDESPRHAVTLTKAYYMDDCLVTVGMWKKYAAARGETMPSLRPEVTDLHPIHNVSWNDVQGYLAWTSVALPTEAQWERAAKGGHDDFVYPWGTADDVKKRNGSGAEDGFPGLSPVKSYSANDYGLYDMSGNVWEWCADGERTYEAKAETDPVGRSASGSSRVVRGGDWFSDDAHLRSSHRSHGLGPSRAFGSDGFRCARSLPSNAVASAAPASSPAKPAWAKTSKEQDDYAVAHGLAVAFENSIGMRFVLIPPGTFQMGSPESENHHQSEETQHQVTLSKPYYMSVDETTNAQYRKFDPSHDSGALDGESLNADDQPAVMVSHDDATKFLEWLGSEDRSRTYRLPTEAEREYACRAGTRTARWWGDDEDGAKGRASVFDSVSKEKLKISRPSFSFDDGYRVTASVGSFAPNPWGLYDMLGNVWDWCADWYDAKYYASSPARDPTGPASGSVRVLRGGSWADYPGGVRSACRDGNAPDDRAVGFGLRVCVSAAPLR